MGVNWEHVGDLVDAQLTPKMPTIIVTLGIAVVLGVIRRRRARRRWGNCPRCAGTGSIPGTPPWMYTRCERCGGSGWV